VAIFAFMVIEGPFDLKWREDCPAEAPDFLSESPE
jgi:hypothetical protein